MYSFSPKHVPEVNLWAGYPLLKHIAYLESWGDLNKEPREFLPDGSVLLRTPNPNDIGLGQINLPTWGAKAKELGFDLYTYDGNLAMTNGYSIITVPNHGNIRGIAGKPTCNIRPQIPYHSIGHAELWGAAPPRVEATYFRTQNISC
jgi:hypothetical protein